jgi:hypothetical protein
MCERFLYVITLISLPRAPESYTHPWRSLIEATLPRQSKFSKQ